MSNQALSPIITGHIARQRKRLGLTQGQLAVQSGLHQTDISRLENGKRSLSLDETVRLAKALEVSLQWFVSGDLRPGADLPDLALELRSLGMVDLLVPEERVPGAFRSPEEIVACVVGVERPEPRIIEAIPAILAWNRYRPDLLAAFARATHRQALVRVAWLAEITLTIHRNEGFPGGITSGDELTEYLNRVDRPAEPDDLGLPGATETAHRVWKYWRIEYAADLATFRDRAAHLAAMRQGQPTERAN